MRAPRIARISGSLSLSKSVPSKVIEPPTTRPLSGNSRIIESTLTVLPEPDSPTMPVEFAGGDRKTDSVNRAYFATRSEEGGL